MSGKVLILGNGFDLDLGMKTRYSDFANSDIWEQSFQDDMQSREEASSYFSTNDLKRADLETICKQLDLPFTKKENMKILQEKIIEGTVGYKLRSQAIQK